MKIAVFGIRSIPSTYSGYETALTTLLPELVQRGHSVEVLARRHSFTVAEYDGVKVRPLVAPGGKNFDTLLHGFVAALYLVFHRPDVALVMNVANALPAAILRLAGVPVVLNVDGEEWKRAKWGRVARGVFRRSAQLARYGATAIVTDCRAMQRVYRENFRTDSTVIPYPIPQAPPSPSKCSGRSPYYVAAARANPENHLSYIAEEFSRTSIDAELQIYGTANYSSPELHKLRSIAATDPRVVLMGHQDNRSVFLATLRDARAYIHGHSVGGINPSLVEAMSVGARILALDTSFNREPLAGAGTYFGLTRGSLATALEKQHQETPHTDRTLRLAASTRAREQFELREIADAYEELCNATAQLGRRFHTRIPTHWEDPNVKP